MRISNKSVPNDGEHVDQYECENSSQNDGSPIACHWANHIQQSILTIHNIKQLYNDYENMTDHIKDSIVEK